MKPEIIIRKNFLRNFLIVLLAVFFAGSALSALVIFFNIHKPLDSHYSAIIYVITELRESLIMKTMTVNLVFFVLIAAGSGLLTLIYTHRIAGPLRRIKHCTKAIAGGNLDTKAKFRHNDAINAFADSLNDMTEFYGNKVTTLSAEVQQLHSAVNEFRTLAEEGRDTGAARDVIDMTDSKIRSILETLKT